LIFRGKVLKWVLSPASSFFVLSTHSSSHSQIP
jgi:hypothetical protein